MFRAHTDLLLLLNMGSMGGLSSMTEMQSIAGELQGLQMGGEDMGGESIRVLCTQ